MEKFGQDSSMTDRTNGCELCSHLGACLRKYHEEWKAVFLAGHVPVTYLRPMKGQIAAGMIRRSCPPLWQLNAWRGHDRDHAWHFRHAHMRKKLFPKFLPASASWSKVCPKFRPTSNMLNFELHSGKFTKGTNPDRVGKDFLSPHIWLNLPGYDSRKFLMLMWRK